MVEGVDRAVALPHRHQGLAVDDTLYGGVRCGNELALGVEAALNNDAEADDVEVVGQAVEGTQRHQLEARRSTVVGVALALTLLHVGKQRRDARIVGGDVDADFVKTGAHVGTPRLVGDQDVAAVAHRFRRNVLVGARILGHGRAVEPALVGEGGIADVGRMGVGGAVEALVEQTRNTGELAEAVYADTCLIGVGELGLEQERGNQGDKVGVAATFAEAVERALDLAHTGAHRSKTVGDGVLGIVLGVNAELVAGDMGHDLADDALDLVGQRAAVGIAQHDPACAGIGGSAQAVEGKARIGLVAVEEVLGVEHRFLPAGDGRGDAVGDQGDRFFGGRAERDLDVVVPRLADEAHGFGSSIEHRHQAGIVGSATPGAARHAEGGEHRPAERRRVGEERRVGGVGARPAALDVVDSEGIERFGHGALVLDVEVHAAALVAVAQRRVEEVEALAAHPARLHVVPAAESSRMTPPASSSRRIRSASAKSLARRAAVRRSTNSSMRWGSSPAPPWNHDPASCASTPINAADARRSAAASASLASAASASACRAAMAPAVLRSSSNGSSTESCTDPAGVSPAARYQRSRALRA